MFYVIINKFGEYRTKAEYPGCGPAWSCDALARQFPTADHAYTFIGNMHPEYRARLEPMVCEAYWVEIGGPDKFGKTLAIRAV